MKDGRKSMTLPRLGILLFGSLALAACSNPKDTISQAAKSEP